MLKKLFIFLLCFINYSAYAASGTDCTNKVKNTLTNLLQQSNIDISSKTLASDVTSILEPKFLDIVENDADCKGTDLIAQNKTKFSIPYSGHTFDIELLFSNSLVDLLDPVDKPEELESLFPWYGILVVKKGSLDKYANSDTPIISTEYMKSHKDEFFPGNSDRVLGLRRACTHGNHMAHDKDTINLAAHMTMNEDNSFWKGNDYYIYDGEDVYWGWATIAGEVALALATLGASAAAQASATSAQAAAASAQAAGATLQAANAAIRTVKLTQDSAKINKAIRLAKAAKAGKDTAAVTSRTEAVAALADAGITVRKGARASELVKIGNSLDNIKDTIQSATKTIPWTTAMVTGLKNPWRLVKDGITTLKPKNLAKLYGPGVSWGRRFKNAIPVTTVAGVSLWNELRKAWGYSTAAVKIDDNLKFNSFGLLSADNLDGRENEVSHGAWLKFDEIGTANEDDALNEALAFAEAFQEDLTKENLKDNLCDDLDIYVVQPGVSNPEKMRTREVFYVIQNPAGSIRVSTPK